MVIIAFLGGCLTLLSPCTLPVIPLLFASFGRDKRHLAALLAGMVTMFTLVALLASATQQWIIQANAWGRWLALGLLAVMALSLISPRIASTVMHFAVRAGERLDNRSRRTGGVLSALLAGLSVGLLWAPCAGPILGAILSTTMLNGANGQTALVLAAYGSGAAAMLALLWLCGDRLFSRLRASLPFSERLRQGAGVAMLGAVVLIGSGASSALQGAGTWTTRLEQQLLSWRALPQPAVTLQPVSEPVVRNTMPPLAGAVSWLNSAPLTPQALKGKVVLVDFWTFDCINCQHTLPYVKAWAEKYRDQGLVVIGVHTPEYPFEKNIQSLQNVVRKENIRFPVAVDNNYAIWNAFGNQYWPAHYYFDAKGQLRQMYFGEGEYQQQEQLIQKLLAEAHS